MRIIGGKYRGRKISAPDTEETRPIADRMKEALFNILGDIEDLSFLDAYAGSGTVGLEAVSRGAAPATLIESGAVQATVIRKNVDLLGAESQADVQQIPVQQWLKNYPNRYDIVFADPPFTDIDQDLLLQLSGRVKRVFILKLPARRREIFTIPGMELVRERKYGNSALAVYKVS